MQLSEITISGYKSILNQNIRFGELNILIGANGSGKSNFIGVFGLIGEILNGNLQMTVAKGGGADKFLHYGKKHTDSIEISFTFGQNGYFLKLSPAAGDTLIFEHESSVFYGNGKDSFPYIDLSASGNKESELASYAKEHKVSEIVLNSLKNWKIYHFHDTGDTSPIKSTNKISDNLYFRKDGANLAAFLYFLMNIYPEHYYRIRDTVRLVTPFFDDFVVRPDNYNTETIKLEWHEKGSDFPFGANDFSDGTLRFICLTTLLQQPNLPEMIIIDEPELGLHPYAINVLASMIKSASKRTQLLISTQSVTLVNQFEPEVLLVVDRAEGDTRISRPDEDELTDWLDDYTLGELWEKNILGGRPTG